MLLAWCALQSILLMWLLLSIELSLHGCLLQFQGFGGQFWAQNIVSIIRNRWDFFVMYITLHLCILISKFCSTSLTALSLLVWITQNLQQTFISLFISCFWINHSTGGHSLLWELTIYFLYFNNYLSIFLWLLILLKVCLLETTSKALSKVK